ncbi:MAG: hypothetical protein PHT99_11150, partial [Methanoregula sp.]|nr:hypothetical protein [Methanoregula sp.]
STIITPQQGLIKLSQGKILDVPMCCLYVFTVRNISLGYYEEYTPYTTDVHGNPDDPVIVYEPVWIMRGSLVDGDPLSLTVSARNAVV